MLSVPVAESEPVWMSVPLVQSESFIKRVPDDAERVLHQE